MFRVWEDAMHGTHLGALSQDVEVQMCLTQTSCQRLDSVFLLPEVLFALELLLSSSPDLRQRNRMSTYSVYAFVNLPCVSRRIST